MTTLRIFEKMHHLVGASAFSLLVSTGLCAETATRTYSQDYRDRVPDTAYDMSEFGPRAGDWEITLGGGGSNDKKFRGGGFNVTGSLGYFFTDNWEAVFRQGFGWSDFGTASPSTWNGSTRAAIDYHFNLDRFRPFIGLNFGAIYGKGSSDTWAAGLEAGVKYYVLPRTFVFAMAEYDWTFRNLRRADNQFDNGQFIYSLGLGFNF